MPQPDWSRGDLSHVVRLWQVNPYNLKSVRSELGGVVRGGQYSLDYYSDLRMSANVQMYNVKWDGTSAIRLVHEVWDYTGKLWEETLGTFYVPADGIKWTDDTPEGRLYTVELRSTLYGMETNVTPTQLTAAKGATAKQVFERVNKITSRPSRIDGDARSYKYSKAVTWDANTSYLKVLMDVAEASGNRIDVVRDGTLIMHGYTEPSKKSPSFSVNSSDPRTLFVGPVEGGDAGTAIPERVIVSATGKVKVRDGTYVKSGKRSDGTTYKAGDPKYKEEDKTITSKAVQAQGHRSRHSSRGFCIDNFIDVKDMSPFTQAQADKLAKQYLAEASQVIESIHHKLMYRPLREGDVYSLTHKGETRRWQIASADLDLSEWTWSIDSKGGWK